jgi:hypothetical protein
VRHTKFQVLRATFELDTPLSGGMLHCDTNLITRGPPATRVTENVKRGTSPKPIIVAPAIPLSWVCQTIPSTMFGLPLNAFKISLQLLGSLRLLGEMVQESWETSNRLHELPLSVAHNTEIVI